MNRPSSRICGIVLLLALTTLPPPSRADFQTDSLALFGSWRWVGAGGGLLAAEETSPPSGWCRVLYLRREGTYALWEQDSVANYLLCSGRFSVHPSRRGHMGSSRHKATLWVELAGWWWQGDQQQQIAFLHPDTILAYPGYEDSTRIVLVADALTNSYVRDRERPAPAGGASPGGAAVYAYRPLRIVLARPWSYVELSPEWRERLKTAGQLSLWADWQFPIVVREGFEYTNHQIPSAVAGDFDGDSTTDVAIYGCAEGCRESKVVCLLSDHGDPRAVTIVQEPTVLDPPAMPNTAVDTYRKPHPALYLSVFHAGRLLEDADGKPRALRTDAILATRLDGATTVFYWDSGRFRGGRAPTRAR